MNNTDRILGWQTARELGNEDICQVNGGDGIYIPIEDGEDGQGVQLPHFPSGSVTRSVTTYPTDDGADSFTRTELD